VYAILCLLRLVRLVHFITRLDVNDVSCDSSLSHRLYHPDLRQRCKRLHPILLSSPACRISRNDKSHRRRCRLSPLTLAIPAALHLTRPVPRPLLPVPRQLTSAQTPGAALQACSCCSFHLQPAQKALPLLLHRTYITSSCVPAWSACPHRCSSYSTPEDAASPSRLQPLSTSKVCDTISLHQATRPLRAFTCRAFNSQNRITKIFFATSPVYISRTSKHARGN
jgi:hypothetical protein